MLVEMELTDSFGNNTRIRFANQQKNPALAASHFSFTPPKGLMWSAATEQPPTDLYRRAQETASSRTAARNGQPAGYSRQPCPAAG
jgi:hypothetical protein